MVEIGIGFSQKQDTFAAAKEASILAKIKIEKYPPVLAFVFTVGGYTSYDLIEGIKNTLGNIKIVGCSSSTIFSNLGSIDYGIYVVVIASNNLVVTTGFAKKDDDLEIEKVGQLFATSLLEGVKKTRHLCLYFADAFLANPSSLIKGIQDGLGKSFPIIGGLASNTQRILKTYQYSDKGVTDAGITGCLFAGNINFHANIKHGWKPLGQGRKITKAKNNIIYELNNEPAIKIYEDFFGRTAAELKKHYFSAITIRYPLGIYIKEENIYILRNILKAQTDGSLLAQGDILQDSKARLMIGSRQTCLEATKDAIIGIKNKFLNKKIYFCVFLESIWRQKLLGIELNKEYNLIKELLGDIPFVWLTSYAEQAPLAAIEYRGQSFFHNDSFLTMAIGE